MSADVYVLLYRFVVAQVSFRPGMLSTSVVVHFCCPFMLLYSSAVVHFCFRPVLLFSSSVVVQVSCCPLLLLYSYVVINSAVYPDQLLSMFVAAKVVLFLFLFSKQHCLFASGGTHCEPFVLDILE